MHVLYFAVILYALYYYVKYKRRYQRLEKMMEQFDGPPTIPILGNAHQFMKSLTGVLKMHTEWFMIYNNQFRFWLLNKPFIAIGTPEDFEIVAHKTLVKSSSPYKFIADIMGDNILTSEVDRWKKHRRIIASALNPVVHFDYFLKVFNKHDKNLVKRLDKEVGTGKHFDLWQYSIRNFSAKICETALGYEDEEGSMEVETYFNIITKGSKLVAKRFYNLWLIPSFNFALYRYLQGLGNIREMARHFPMKVLKQRKGMLELLKGKELQNAVDVLLSTGEIEDEDICAEISILMAAGTETTAIIIGFTMLMFGIEQEIQDKVYGEIFEVFGESDRPPEQSDLSRLPYLTQCIQETMRRFSVVPVIVREACQDIPITNGKIIPAGTTVVLSPLGVHRNADIYPNPDTWDPSNFDPDKVARRHKYSFVAFSVGPRGCVGQNYAYLSLKAQISTLLRNFKITTDVKAKDIELTSGILLKSIHGCKIKLDYRHGRPLF